MSQDTLLTLYKAILESLSVRADGEGLLSYINEGQALAVNVEGRRLALPTPELLRAGNWKERGLIAFHPLSESLVRGESPVLKKFKVMVNIRLWSIISKLLLQLTALAADNTQHQSLSPKAQELLSQMPEADERTVTAVEKIIEASQQDGPNRLIGIYLSRGATYRGMKFSKVAVVSFPILEALDAKDHVVFGVKLRKKDVIGIKNLLSNYILPGADDLETYSAGSNSMEAPYFDCLLKAYGNVAERLNSVTWLHRKHLENEKELLIDLDWRESAKDLSVYRDLIPSLAGNEGELVDVVEQGKNRAIQSLVSGPTPEKLVAARGQIPYQPAPIASSTDEVVRTANGIDFQSLMRANARRQVVPAQAYGYPAPAAVGVGGYAGLHRGMPVSPSPFGFNPPAPVNLPPWAMTPAASAPNPTAVPWRQDSNTV